jgi:hypothetical protein
MGVAKRAVNISIEMEYQIVAVIESISDKISWAVVIEHVDKALKQRYTEQGLRKHKKIADAYHVKSLILAKKRSFRGSRRSQDATARRIVELELQVERLEATNNLLLSKFAVWSYNAATKHNMGEVDLNEPIVVR